VREGEGKGVASEGDVFLREGGERWGGRGIRGVLSGGGMILLCTCGGRGRSVIGRGRGRTDKCVGREGVRDRRDGSAGGGDRDDGGRSGDRVR